MAGSFSPKLDGVLHEAGRGWWGFDSASTYPVSLPAPFAFREAGSGQAPLPLSKTGSARKPGWVKGAKQGAKPRPLTLHGVVLRGLERPGKSRPRFLCGFRVWALGADRQTGQQAHTLLSKKRCRL